MTTQNVYEGPYRAYFFTINTYLCGPLMKEMQFYISPPHKATWVYFPQQAPFSEMD